MNRCSHLCAHSESEGVLSDCIDMLHCVLHDPKTYPFTNDVNREIMFNAINKYLKIAENSLNAINRYLKIVENSLDAINRYLKIADNSFNAINRYLNIVENSFDAINRYLLI